ncbi:MAG: Fur family transcriptional regulator [Acidimicrobiales bacterium]|nr:transcriptional repressor [Actinomycetota bacterium]
MPGTPAPHRLESILGMLRDRGGRLTTARRAIITALLAAEGHVTADELTAAVQQAHPDVHLTTIYRCLDTLEKMGVVDHVHLGHGRAVYHLSDEAHQHLVCEHCGAVIEVPDALFEDLAGRLQADYGFAIRPNHFAVLGRCQRCQAVPVKPQ